MLQSLAVAECEPSHFLFAAIRRGFGVESLSLSLLGCAGWAVVGLVGFAWFASNIHLPTVFVWSHGGPIARGRARFELRLLLAHGGFWLEVFGFELAVRKIGLDKMRR